MKNILTLCTFILASPIAAFSGESNCEVSLDVQFYLRPSAGKLIFDTQSGGSGV
ncbi:hypothetical protein N9777_09695 [Ascidiaceihabitans sp.]|nr:hypothetical protein [Ascidiaceihabitans sp.]